MNAKVYLAELRSDLSRYDQMGLIDESSVYTWIEDAAKRFGKLVCEKADCMIDIIDGSGCLPSDFHSFESAMKCDPAGCNIKKEESDDLQHEFAWAERTERGFRWDSCDECCKEEYKCVITEKFYIKSKEVKFQYSNPVMLNIGNSIKRKQCFNKRFYDPFCPNTIDISGDKIFTNFDTGYVYLRYYAIPRSEDGLPSVFESELGFVYQYIDTYVKRKAFERIFANGDDPNVINKLQFYLAQEPILERKAMGELKMSGIGPDTYKRMADKNRARIEVYDRIFPKL